ncbi:MAG: PaaI family thioesterase [Rubrivivax sp.]
MPTDDIAEQWQAAADADTRHVEPGWVSAEQARSRTGLQVMQALLQGEFPPPHIGRTLDFRLVEVGPGRAVFQGTPQQMHLNPMGGIHGGWYATLLDSALGCAVCTTLPAGRGYTTGQLNLHIVRAATGRSGPLRAIGEVVHAGRQLATAEARIVGPDGKLCAHGSTTCLVFEVPAG